MADNSTHPIMKILESFGLSKIFYCLYIHFMKRFLWHLHKNTYNAMLLTLCLFKKSEECRKS